MCPLDIPRRTRLFSLTPAGIRTPEVESLSGYIARLAQAHVVSVGNLLGRGLTERGRWESSDAPPILAEQTRSGGHGFHALGNAINGFDLRARKWVRKIAAATGRSDIEQLTLIPFAGVLSAMLLFKPYRTWCPFCYGEDRKDGIIYERLVWAISLVTVCPRHRAHLKDACQGCNRRQPALAVFSRAGHCSNCGQWLGADVGKGQGDDVDLSAKLSEYEVYAAVAVGEVLAVGRTTGRLSLARFRRNLSTCAVHVAEGKASVLSELTGISKSAVQSWITTRMRPRLDVLLRMCSNLGVSLGTMLTARRQTEADWRVVEGHCHAVNRGVKRYRSSEEVRCEIDAALHSESPCDIRELTRRLGFQRPERLYQVDGALCHRVTVRYRNCARTHWWRRPGAKRISDVSTIQKLLEESLAMDPPIAVRQIAGDLGYANGGFIHQKFPELCHAIAEKTAAYKSRVLETIRCAILAACDEQPPPTLRELSKRLGFQSYSAVRDQFPELTNRLLDARLEHKRKEDSQKLRTELLFVVFGKEAPALSRVSRSLNVFAIQFGGPVARPVQGNFSTILATSKRNKDPAFGERQ
jgi:hypothetical protein